MPHNEQSWSDSQEQHTYFLNENTRLDKKDILSIKIVGNRAVTQYSQAPSASNEFEQSESNDRFLKKQGQYQDDGNFSETLRQVDKQRQEDN